MHRRKYIVHKILEAFNRGERIKSWESNDTQKDHKLLYKMFSRREDSDIMITEDPDKGLLWFKKRNDDS